MFSLYVWRNRRDFNENVRLVWLMVQSAAYMLLSRQQDVLSSAYKPAIMWARQKKEERKRSLSYRFCLRHSNASLIGWRAARSRPPIGRPGSVKSVESDGDSGEERRDWLRPNWKRKPLSVKACEAVDGVCILGVTPEVIRPTAPPARTYLNWELKGKLIWS